MTGNEAGYLTNRSGKRKRNQAPSHYFDYNLLFLIVLLMMLGLLMLYSTSAYSAEIKFGDGAYYFKKQLIFAIAGFIVMMIITFMDYHLFKLVANISMVFAILLMLLVRVPGFGVVRNGALRWLKLGPITFQPSEVAKIAIILFMAYWLNKWGKGIATLKRTGLLFLVATLTAGIVFVFTDNLSTAIIVFGMACVMIFIAHPKTWPFVLIAIVAVAAIGGGIYLLYQIGGSSDNFRIGRIMTWLEPEKYADTTAYQSMQALYAIGSGGAFGKGLGESAQKMIIPEAQNDMIFSIICEEMGIFGAVIIIFLFVVMLYRFVYIARNAPDLFGGLLVTGVFAHIAIQVVLNIGVVTGMLPTTGITLPFISYGGTSVMFLMMEMGIALSVSRKIEFKYS